MAAKFLFCLPLRLGVFLFTILQFLICGAAAGLDWYLVYYILRYGEGQEGQKSAWDSLPLEVKIAIIAIGAIYTFAAIIGFFGFLGACLRKTAFVKTYFTLLCITFVLQLAGSIGSLVVFYRARGRDAEDCSKKVINLNDQKSIEEWSRCTSLEAIRSIPQGWMIAGAIVPVVLVAYALYVVYHYIKRIQKQNMEKEMRYKTTVGPVYTSVAGKEETHPLTQPAVTYPYRDGPNAFGSNGANKV